MTRRTAHRVRGLCRLLLTAACGYAGLAPAQQASEEAQAQQSNPNQVIEEVVAVGRLRSTVLDVVTERLEQDVVTDFLGVEQIARTGDSTVSLALRRVPGLTLVNDQFVYVRGLGERYSSALLNGAHVPSPDLTRNVIPLDIFPTEILQALAVQKGFSPDMPAAFGGGNVNIITRGIPNGPVASVEFESGWNFHSEDGLHYPGGSGDRLGEDDGTRAFPAAISAAIQQYQGNIGPTGIFNGLKRDGNFHAFSEAESLNRELATALNRNVEITSRSMNPDGGIQAALGNRWFFGADEQWEFGALGLLSYDQTWRNRDRVNRSVLDPAELFAETERTVNQVSLTNVINLGLSFTEDHEINTSALLLRNTEDEASITTGHTFNFIRADGQAFRNYRIRFEERELQSNQIRGHHVIGQDTREIFPLLDRDWLEGLTYDWYYSDSTAVTGIPNEILFSAEDSIDPDNNFALISTAIRSSISAADYRFTDLDDDVESYGWDLMKAFQIGGADVEVSGGQDYTRKARSYLQSQLTLGATAIAARPALVGTPAAVFSDRNILNPLNEFILNIGGIGTESYLAAQLIDARYFKVDALLNDAWRIAGGVRWERFIQASLPIDQLEFDVGAGQTPIANDQLHTIIFREDDLYPALSATWMRPNFWAEEFQLRFGVSETVARPDLREISESTYIDPLTEARIRGRSDLITSAISNFDIRAEWFFGNGDNFTTSFFYKDIANPIETAQGAGTDDNISLTFVNAASAEITGLEVEWLKDLSFLGDRLGGWIEQFFFGGNLTFSDSQLVVGNVGLNLTNNERAMSQHSDFVSNVQLGFDSFNGVHSWSLVYNSFSERLFFAGIDGAEDAFEQPFDSLDFIYSFYPTDQFSFKLRFQNILDERTEIEQSGVTVLEQTLGPTAKLEFRWDLGGP